MLEVVNLSKIYQSKGGAEVKALDGVSVRFPERGMVFLLGKSGSGKSTLLNLCGGLDAPSSGEIIVKGRSSKDFSQSDFDSYRNTFVGFIFQEYNILNEFTVEDNIALALELQGKSKDKATINALLEQVDLTGYAKRKPNTLSGGQKQRIAIARALVKSPEIIMADEPTGALDSATGKQVFDTLKKLSRDKLVLVVSHDRDFAEQYGDRVIELMDGKIISDVSKVQEQQRRITENVSAVGDTLCIKRGATLDDRDFAQIKSFLQRAEADVVIAAGERDVQSFKKVNRITENGEKEVFLSTDEEALPKKQYTPEDSRFIRSRLPLRHAVKIGTSGLKNKPFRLALTILLCTVAFVMFGLLSTMMFYDSEATFRQTLIDSDYETVRIIKNYMIDEKVYQGGALEYEYSYYQQGFFSDEEIDALREEYGFDVIGGAVAHASFQTQTSSSYWNNNITYFAYLPEGNSLRNRITVGTYPAQKGEICISSFAADTILNCQTYDYVANEPLEIQNVADLIGKSINLNGDNYTIVGIFECEALNAKYDVLKDNTATDNYSLKYEFSRELSDGFHLVAFLSREELTEYAANRIGDSTNIDSLFYDRHLYIADRYDYDTGCYTFDPQNNYGKGFYLDVSTAGQPMVFFDGSQTALGEGEVVLSLHSFLDRYRNGLDQATMTAESPEQREKLNALRNIVDLLYSGTNDLGEPLTDTKRSTLFAQLMDAMSDLNVDLTVQFMLYNPVSQSPMGEIYTLTITGIYGLHEENYDLRLLLTDALADTLWNAQKSSLDYYTEQVTAYKRAPGAIYGTLFLPYDHSAETTQLLADICQNQEFDENDTRIELSCSVIDSFYTVDTFVQEASKIFLYVGLVIALFSILLLSNFISVSISQKKREIGILRAVGARSIDVFKIFFSESFFITLICTIFSVVGSIIVCDVLNKEMASALGTSIFVFGVLSFVILAGIALLTSILATFVPVWNAAKKKPVDSIRAL